MRREPARKPIVPFHPDMRREDIGGFYGRHADSVGRRVGSTGCGSALCGWLPGGADKRTGPARDPGSACHHPLWKTWKGARTRVHNPRIARAHRYSLRGIDMDPRWDDFWVFVDDVGLPPHPSYTLDRVDNDRGYWPDNVRWATPREQVLNSDHHKPIPPFARDVDQVVIARYYGLPEERVHYVLRDQGRLGSVVAALVQKGR